MQQNSRQSLVTSGKKNCSRGEIAVAMETFRFHLIRICVQEVAAENWGLPSAVDKFTLRSDRNFAMRLQVR